MDSGKSENELLTSHSYLVTERPAGMSYEAYKLLRSQQNKSLKKYLRGTFTKIVSKKKKYGKI